LKKLIIFALIILSFNALGLAVEKLPNGDLAYYPKSFYEHMKAKKVTVEELYDILSQSHSATNGDYDQVGRCQSNCYAHKSIGYSEARMVMFGERDLQTSGNEKFIIDVYCGKKITFKSTSDVSHMGSIVNIEHTWPQSKFSTKYEKMMQKSDMHHLYLTDAKANGDRGNHEFGIQGDAVNEIRADHCDSSALFREGGDWLFQPPAKHRGNVARSLFYFSTHYGLPISKKQEAALRQWHVADPVDAQEIAKHEIVVGHQNVRNPFVDFPQLVDQIADF
jgi:hypothetical protein